MDRQKRKKNVNKKSHLATSTNHAHDVTVAILVSQNYEIATMLNLFYTKNSFFPKNLHNLKFRLVTFLTPSPLHFPMRALSMKVRNYEALKIVFFFFYLLSVVLSTNRTTRSTGLS